ncbi:pyrroline-5-carboxylate reductase [Halalkalibacterium ligniniphilum]|uniref:pyrroline-5-carboxylate reductase n=1 Tax=Halalkalibacterium ligniniphilum TaxID=1134413 RepID=UPI00034662A6|nr:pyrroline-5-carboxylate reductase [Halalkalibacterium ligniniphilum]
MLQNKTITFLGAGSMAESIIAGLVAQQIVVPHQIIATNQSDEEKLAYLENRYQIRTLQDREQAVKEGDIVVLAMKPKNVKEAIEDVKHVTSKDQLFVSVLAGIPTTYIEDLLGHNAPVIRTMPNTSAKVGASATGISAGKTANSTHMVLVTHLFEAIGTVTTVTEDKLDAVTGIAGSGPAYFYYLVEAMERAAADAGLSENEAKVLLAQTLIGVGKRLLSTTKSTAELYKEVMSPGGTTEAGIGVLQERETQAAMQEAVTRAIARSTELGSVFTELNK